MKKILEFLWRVKVYTIIVVIILAIVGFSMYKKANSAPKLEFDKVTRQTVVDVVSESGNIILEGQANIMSSAEGVVSKIYVKNGDHVYTGQALFSAQSTASDQDKATALASLLSASSATNTARQTKISLQASLDTAQQAVYSAERAYQITESGFRHKDTNPATSKTYKQIEVDAAAKTLSAAQQNLEAASLRVNDADQSIAAAQETEAAAKLNYDNKNAFTVKAPSSGVVSNISINVGDKVNTTLAGGKSVLVITRSKNLLFTAQINENEITKLKIDQTASIIIDAIKEKTFNGKVKNIDAVGTNIAGVVIFNVYFTVDDADANLLSGMSGSVEIEVARHENVLTVANAAIKPYQSGKAVQITDTSKPSKNNDSELKYITIKTGLKGTERTEIIEGLEEGMEIVINNTTNQFKSNLFGG